MANDFLLQFQHKFYIDITENADIDNPTWTRFATGWKSVDITENEEIDEVAYLDGEGGKTTTVMGGTISFDFTGDFDNANDVHLFILGKIGRYGIHRIVPFKWETPAPEGFDTGYVFKGLATLSNIAPASGDADAKSEITVTVTFNGKPDITPPSNNAGDGGE